MRDKCKPCGAILLAVAALLWIVPRCELVPAAKGAIPAAEITGKDDGNLVRLVVGQELNVRLEARPGTGYQWTVLQPLAFLKLERSDFEGGGLPGGTEIQALHFRATSAGQGRLLLHYVQPWANDAPPERTFALSIKAVKG
jgi:predicted secreted protein